VAKTQRGVTRPIGEHRVNPGLIRDRGGPLEGKGGSFKIEEQKEGTILRGTVDGKTGSSGGKRYRESTASHRYQRHSYSGTLGGG